MNNLITSIDPTSNVSEAFKTLRTNIMYRNFDKELKLINIVSTIASEGKTTTLVNLANAYVQLGKKVLIIDLDLRKPSLHHKLHIKNGLGINDFITGKANLEQVITKFDSHFYVITAGSKTLFYNELIQSENLHKFLTKIKESFDMVFIDCPPIGAFSDGVILSTLCDGTILTVETNKVDKRAIKKTYDQLQAVNSNVIGAVLTKVDTSKNSYKYYNYEYK